MPNKERIGTSTGIDVPAAAACITEVGEAASLVKEISTRLEELRKRGSNK